MSKSEGLTARITKAIGRKVTLMVVEAAQERMKRAKCAGAPGGRRCRKKIARGWRVDGVTCMRAECSFDVHVKREMGSREFAKAFGITEEELKLQIQVAKNS